MKTVLMTGLNGTVAPHIKKILATKGIDTLAWPRDVVSPDDQAACTEFMDRIYPDAIFHIGMGAESWAAQMAAWCKNKQKPFVFTSTVSVFAHTSMGPFTVEAEPDAQDDYGSYKRRCEEAIKAVNPEALVVRLGWQIGDGPGSNNMVDYFYKQAEGRKLSLSNQWYPGCSFLEDTAETLVELFLEGRQGLFHLNGNPGLNQYEIGLAINKLLGNPWDIEAVDAPAMNSLMRDPRVPVKSISEHFIAND